MNHNELQAIQLQVEKIIERKKAFDIIAIQKVGFSINYQVTQIDGRSKTISGATMHVDISESCMDRISMIIQQDLKTLIEKAEENLKSIVTHSTYSL